MDILLDNDKTRAQLITELAEMRHRLIDFEMLEIKHRQTEEQQQKLIAELEAFAHTVAHDLNTPLAVIIGFADLLVDDCLTMPAEQLQNSLQTIAWTGRKMKKIIDELLLLAEVRTQDDIPIGSLDMATIVTEVQRSLTYMIDQYQAEIILPPDWPVALGYAPWVEEVWANYLSNGIKYGDQPPRLKLGANEQPDGMVRFWVRDNGQGLTLEQQRQLFVPFVQLSQVRTQGHGLGLSIVLRIINKLGGQVGVESEGVPGQGSLFYFTLPSANGRM